MLKIPKEYIIEKIKKKSKLSEEEIKVKIKQKLDALSGLISEEGAAHIIANELGVDLMEQTDKLQVKGVLAGMRNVELVGKVTNVFEVRTFQTEQRSGKVGSFMLGDETGVIRITAWGDKADVIKDLQEGYVVKLKSGYARENNGRVELHLNDNSDIIINPKDASVGEVKTRIEAKRKKISELSSDDQNTEILGTIVSAFDPRFFEVCSTCGKRSREVEGRFTCQEHGVVSEPDYSYVMNVILDDGTDNIRTIFFRNQLQHLLNKTHEEVIAKKDSAFDDEKTDLLGKIIKVIGRVTTNEMFGRQEFVAQIVDPNPNPQDEIKRLDKEGTATVSEGSSSIQEETRPEATEEVSSTTESIVKDEGTASEPSEKTNVQAEVKAPVDKDVKTSVPVDALDSDTETIASKKALPEDLDEEPVSIDDLEDLNEDDIYE